MLENNNLYSQPREVFKDLVMLMRSVVSNLNMPDSDKQYYLDTYNEVFQMLLTKKIE